MKGKKKLLIPVVVGLALLAGGIYRYWRDQPGGIPGAIRVSGNIEAVTVDVGFQSAGRVVARLVDEGQMVRAGDVIARLDDAELRQDFAARSAEVQLAQAALDALLAGSRPEEIAQAEADAQRAKVDQEYRKLVYDRQKHLLEIGSATSQEFDDAAAAMRSADAALAASQARLKLVQAGPRKEDIEQGRSSLAFAEQALALAKNGPRKETIEQARARLEQARQLQGQAQTRLDYATLRSPVTGVVLSKNVEPGEYVFPGTPVVTVADLADVWLRAYVNETDLDRLRLGSAANVTTDSLSGKAFPGRLSFIAAQAEFTPKNVQTREERVKLVYRVKIDIANPLLELKVGMPADADILLGQPAPAPASSPAPPEKP